MRSAANMPQREITAVTAELITGPGILVPIDLHGINRGTLETLVRIARLLDRSLLGLLLEDVRLQQVADLPFTTEITLSGARERSLLRDHLSRRHLLVDKDARRLLNELAGRDRVALRFEHAAGSRLLSALARDGRLDIFFPARQRWQPLTRGSAAAGAAVRRLGIVLAQTAQDQQVLNIARMLMHAGQVVELYVLSSGPMEGDQLKALYHPGSRICVQANLKCDQDSLSRLIRQSAYDLLLLPRDCAESMAPQVLEDALDRSATQVLVINEGDGS